MGDIRVTHGRADVPGDSVGPHTFTLSNTIDPDKSILMVTNNRYQSGGPTASTANQTIAQMSALASLPGTDDEVNFIHAGTGAAGSLYRTDYSIVEYIGPVGGDNEFKILDVVLATLAVGETSKEFSVDDAFGADLNDVVPFITSCGAEGGQRANEAEVIVTAIDVGGSINIRVERGASNEAMNVQVTVVGFTGSNWTVRHGRLNTDGDTGNISLREAADGLTGAVNGISDWANAFIVHSHFGDNTNVAIEDTSAIYYPQGFTTTPVLTAVQFLYSTGHLTSGASHMVHVVEHADMDVSIFSDTTSHTGAQNVDITAAGLTDLEQAFPIVSRYSSGGGTAYGRGWVNARLTSLTNLELWVHRNGNTIFTVMQTVDFSGIETPFTCDVDATLPSITSDAIARLRNGGALSVILPIIGASVVAGEVFRTQADLTLPSIGASAVAAIMSGVAAVVDITLPFIGVTALAGLSSNALIDVTLPLVETAVVGQLNGSAQVDVTLPSIEAAAVARLSDSAQIDITLPAIEAEAAAQLGNTTQVDVTLPAVEADADAREVFRTQADLTLPAVQTDILASQGQSAQVDVTLPSLEVDADAEVQLAAAIDITLPSPTVDADAEIEAGVVADITLPSLMVDADALLRAEALLDLTLPAVIVDADAVIEAGVVADVTLPAIQVDAALREVFRAQTDITLPAVEVTAVAGLALSTAIDVALPSLTADLVGRLSQGAVVDVTLPSLVVAVLVREHFDIVGDVTLPGVEVEALANVIETPSGAVDVTLPAITVDADGRLIFRTAFDVTLPAVDASVLGDAGVKRFGRVDITLPAINAVVLGDTPLIVLTDLQLPSLETSALAREIFGAVVDVTLPALESTLRAETHLRVQADLLLGSITVTALAETTTGANTIALTLPFIESSSAARLMFEVATSVTLPIPQVRISDAALLACNVVLEAQYDALSTLLAQHCSTSTLAGQFDEESDLEAQHGAAGSLDASYDPNGLLDADIC